MKLFYLIKPSEIYLKGGNRRFFENILVRNIKAKLKGDSVSVKKRTGRFYVDVSTGDSGFVEDLLSKTPGIAAFSRSRIIDKDLESITKTALELADEQAELFPGSSFKVVSRRTDKGFAYNSYEISSHLGSGICERHPGLKVRMRSPDWQLNVEVRENAYLFCSEKQGTGGLPVGCAGKGLLLLSGGIDSPVAGFRMARRGVKLDAVYFHTPPFTSGQAKQKVIDLAGIMAPYCEGIRLFIVNFSQVQLYIRDNSRSEELTLLTRAAMVKIAEALAGNNRGQSLVTGESLSQVASQTIESLSFTNSVASLPVLRPLIGMDKEEIIRTAKKINTFDTSIQPHPDCCHLFSPNHPLTRPNKEKLTESFLKLGLDEMIEYAAEKAEITRFSGKGTKLS